MGQRDIHNSIEQRIALKLQTISTDTDTDGEIIDMEGYESVEFLFALGTVTDGDYAVRIEDGDDSGLSDAAAVDDKFLLGTEAGASFDADNDDDKVSKIGYIGPKRFVRLTIVSTNTSSGAVVGGIAILNHTRRTEGLTGQKSA